MHVDTETITVRENKIWYSHKNNPFLYKHCNTWYR